MNSIYIEYNFSFFSCFFNTIIEFQISSQFFLEIQPIPDSRMKHHSPKTCQQIIMHCKLFLSFLVIFALYFLLKLYLLYRVSSSDLVVSEKCSVKLTDENFKSIIESNGIDDINLSFIEFVFVFFYSATCPACRRFDPIWEDTSCSLHDKNIIFAHLEGNENQGVINTYSVTHTPTLALFHKVIHLLSFSFVGFINSHEIQWTTI